MSKSVPLGASSVTAPPTTSPSVEPGPTRSLPSSANDPEERRHRKRWLLCIGCAFFLHAGLSLVDAGESRPHLAFAAFDASELSTFVDVVVESPAADEAPAPGGGSPEPEPEAKEEAKPARPLPAPPEAPAVAEAPEELEDARLADVAPEAEPDPEAEPASGLELLGEPDLDGDDLPDTVRPTAIRRSALALARRPTATAPIVAASDEQASRHYGLGPGRGGGPGGKGSGWGNGDGVVRERFTFGGPSGAFRADVCFIPERTPNLASITRCPREATFYTDTLDVSPRRFNAGFPGVTSRSEWFAIRYRGKFNVRESGQYYFRLLSDDGSRLYVDGYLIVDNDGTHPPSARQGNMRLMAGEHELFVSYFQGPRDNIALQLFVTPPGGEEQILTPEI